MNSFYLMPDYLGTDISSEIFPSEIIYGSTIGPQTYSVKVRNCLHEHFKVQSLTFLNGTKLDYFIQFDYLKQSLTINLPEADLRKRVGALTLKSNSYFRNKTLENYIRVYLTVPSSMSTSAATTSASAPYGSCDMPIYPLYYGGSREVNTVFMGFDANQYIMLAGSSNQLPFNDQSNLISSGYIAVIDYYGKPKWSYRVSFQFPNQTATVCSSIADSSTFYIALCQSKSLNYNGAQTVNLLKVQKSDGQITTIKEIIGDNYDIANQTPLYSVIISNQLYIAMRYKSASQQSFALTSINLNSYYNEYIKIYPGSQQRLNYEFLVDGSNIVIIQQQQAFPVQIYQSSLTTGQVLKWNEAKLGNYLNSDGLAKGYIGAGDIFIPILTLSTNDQIILYQIDKTDFSFSQGITINLASSLAIASVGVFEAQSGQIYVIAAGSATIIMKFDADYSNPESFYSTDSSTLMNVLSIGQSVGGIIFGLSGTYQGQQRRSTMIFNLDTTDLLLYNCFEMKDGSALITLDTDSTSMQDAYLQKDLSKFVIQSQPLLTNSGYYDDAYNVIASTASFLNDGQEYNWGLNLIPAKNHQFPNNLYQCGGYAKQNDIQETTFSYTYTSGSGDQTIVLAAPDNSCQNRPQKVSISYHPNLIKDAQIVSFNKDTRTLTINTDGVTQTLVFSVIIIYYDEFQPFSQFSFTLNFEITQATAFVPLDPASTCSKILYPLSFGGSCQECDMTVYDFEVDTVGGYYYIGGQANSGNSFVDSIAMLKAGFLMKLTDFGVEQWFSQIQISQQNDFIQTLALGSADLYAYLNSNEDQSSLIKVDLSNGKLKWAKQFNAYTLNSDLQLRNIRDIKIDPSDATKLLFAYNLRLGQRETSGTILANDNSNVLSGLYASWIEVSSSIIQQHQIGEVIYNADTSYVSTHTRFTQQNGQIIVNKQDSSDPSDVIWSRSYEVGSFTKQQVGLNPTIISDGGSPYNLYVVGFARNLNVIKIQADGTTSAHINLNPSSTELFAADIVYDASNDQIIILMIQNDNQGLKLLSLDNTLAAVSGKDLIYDSMVVTMNFGKLGIAISSDAFLISYNVALFGHSNSKVQEIFLNQRSFDLSESNTLNCNKEQSLTAPTINSVTPLSSTGVVVQVLQVTWTTYEVGGIFSTQNQDNNNRIILANSMEAIPDQKVFSEQCDGTTGTRRPEVIAYANIETLTLSGAASSVTIDPEDYFSQCQGLEIETQLQYSNGVDNTENLDSLLFTLDDLDIEVDPSSLELGYSQRQVLIKSCILDQENLCSIIDKNFVLNPSSPFADPTTRETCALETDFPKVLGSQTSNINVADANYWSTGDKFISCGDAEDGFFTDNDYLVNGRNGYIMSVSEEGEIQWTYSVSQKFGSNTSYVSCDIDQTQNIIYGLINVVDSGNLIITKQNPINGKISLILKGFYGNAVESQFNKAIVDSVDSSLYLIVDSSREKSSQAASHILYKVDLTAVPVEYLWTRYIIPNQQNSASAIQSIALTSTDIFMIGEIKVQSQNYITIRKVSKDTGILQDSLSFPIKSFNFENQVVFDSSNLFVFYSEYETETCNKYIGKYSTALAATIQKLVALPEAQNIYYSSVDFDSTSLFEIFSISDDALYFIKYTKSTLDISAFKKFQMTDLAPKSVTAIVINSDFYQFFTSQQFVSHETYSSILMSLSLTLVPSNPCMSFTDVTQSLSLNPVSSVDLSSEFEDFSTLSSIVLETYFGLEWHLHQSFIELSYVNSQALSCKASGISLRGILEDQVVVIPQTGEFSIDLDNICSDSDYAITLTVDGEASVPPFITSILNPTEFVISFTPAEGDVGLYRVRLRFENNNGFVEKVFSLDVYPERYFGQDIVEYEFSCPTQFMHWHQTDTEVRYTSADVDPSSQNFIICGSILFDDAVNPAYYKGYISQLNKGFATLQHISIDLSGQDTHILDCFYGYQGNIQTAANQWNIAKTQIETILLLKHSPKAKFLAAKEFKQTGKEIYGESYIVDYSQGKQYIGGQINDFDLTSMPFASSFIAMLDSDYTIISFKIFDTQNKGTMPKIVIDSDQGTTAFLLGYENTQDSKLYWALNLVDSELLKTQWSKTLRNDDLFIRGEDKVFGDLKFFDGLLYSCIPYSKNTEWSLNLYQPSSGKILSSIEMSRESDELNNCELTYHESENVHVMTFSFFEETYLIMFNITKQNQLNIIQSRVLQLFTQRLIPSSTFTISKEDVFYLLVRAVNFDDLTEHLFFTQGSSFVDGTWDNPCTNSTLQNLSPQSTIESINPVINRLKESQDEFWQDFEAKEKYVYTEALNTLYLSNNKHSSFLVETTNEYLLKETFEGCLGFNYPDLPDLKEFTGEEPTDTEYGAILVSHTTYDEILPEFSHCSHDTIVYSIELDEDDLPSWITFDPDTRTIELSPDTNDYVGTYTINYYATILNDNTIISQQDFELEVLRNYPPAALDDYEIEYELSAFHSRGWTVTLDEDPEGDTAIFDADLLDLSGNSVMAANTWFTIEVSDDNHIELKAEDPTYNSGGNNDYQIQISLFDEFNVDTPSFYYIYLTIRENGGAVLDDSVNRTFDSSYLAATVSYQISASGFTDIEEDSQTVSCTASASGSASVSWINYANEANGDLTISGTIPSSASNIALYTFSCKATDEFEADGPSYSFTLDVVDNVDITTQEQDDITITYNNTASDSTSIDLSETCTDSQGEEIIYTLSINGDPYNSASHSALGFSWDVDSLTLDYTMNSNVDTGVYSIELSCDDSFHSPSVVSFTITAEENQPILITGPIAQQNIWLADESLQIVDPSLFFTDPEDYLYSLSLRQTGQPSYPSFITEFDDDTATIALTLTAANVGNYNMELLATDNIGQVTTVPFVLTVKQCFTGCKTCTDVTETTCLSCNDNYYFNVDRCGTTCPDKYFKDDENNACTACPSQCSVCSGSNNEGDCTVCESGFYLQNGNSCLEKCSPDQWGNPLTFTCTKLNLANYDACLELVDSLETTGSFKTSLASVTGSTVSCTGNDLCSDGTDGSSGCSWQRKFAAQCTYATDQTVLISIISNTLPNHCMYSGDQNLPASTEIQFSVAFNIAKSQLVRLSTMTTSAQISQYLCTSSWQSTFSSSLYHYSISAGASIPFVGVSRNGVLFMTGNSADNQDAFYPKTVTLSSIVEFDSCLGSSSDRPYYNYLSFSPCIFSSTPQESTSAESCTTVTNCNTNPLKYSYQFMTTLQKVIQPIGIARDGHMILGPYSDSGSLWQPCDVDICNGVTYNGNYAYAVTMFHPYTIGCWGPAQTKNLMATCTSQTAATCSLGYNFQSIVSLMIIILISISLML